MAELKFLAYIFLVLLFTSCEEPEQPLPTEHAPATKYTAHTHEGNASRTTSIPDHIDAQYLTFEYTIPYITLQSKMERRLSRNRNIRY